ncbi:hypothetical protein CEUSTIGMA_g2357.t1 [Chlamydomonas eustigma]|uniref:Uncharacterized protein n=1 Tax=Chlamydomonas eustigma TaxID=1157962 RepID=A0A250WVR5_9CHLO|nr:hypothetical protein CEUSTIGMA_g2357.t1 [Chlamydomonas eustigma]|eukprot:GAX74911.1 hypothetical protein CEUSTIGMA_g2357.t1 [Chlamydomonas eustigma]
MLPPTFLTQTYHSLHSSLKKAMFPPGWRNGLRLAITVTVFMMLGLLLKNSIKITDYAFPILLYASWGAIISILLTNPVLGKSSQTGFHYIVGGMLGGFIGTGLAYSKILPLIIIFVFILIIVSIIVGTYLKAEAAHKLFGLLLVTVLCMPTALPVTGPLEYCIGILVSLTSGVVLNLIISTFVFPSSAIEIIINSMREALDSAVELHLCSWEVMGEAAGQLWQGSRQPASIAVEGSTEHPLMEDLETSRQQEEDAAKLKAANKLAAVRRCEVANAAFLRATRAVEEHLLLADHEVFAGIGFGHHMALPKWMCSWAFRASSAAESSMRMVGWRSPNVIKTQVNQHMVSPAAAEVVVIMDTRQHAEEGQGAVPRNAPSNVSPVQISGALHDAAGARSVEHASLVESNTLPKPQVICFLSCLRRVVRAVWAQQLALSEGFDEEFVSVLRQRYPEGILHELRDAAQSLLHDLADAMLRQGQIFKADRLHAASESLEHFRSCLQQIMEISTQQYSQLVRRIEVGYFPSTASTQDSSSDTALTELERRNSQAQAVLERRTSMGVPLAGLIIQQKQQPQQCPCPVHGDANDENGGVDKTMIVAVTFASTSVAPMLATEDFPISHLVFPPTPEGFRHRLRWHATKFSTKQLLQECSWLLLAMHEMLPLLPGVASCWRQPPSNNN